MANKKYIKTPGKMWELFLEYKAETKSKPVLVQDFVGKDANEVMREKEQPLTMEGFENFVSYKPKMPVSLTDYFINSNGAYSEFSTICSRIRREIRADQIKGGLVGIYNTSITQRLNNLVEKTENKLDVDLKQITGIEIK